ncbi:hypothetical protein D3C87_1631770 [compost metagenome]
MESVSGGSLAGPNRANHALDSKPLMVSPMGGTPGNCGSACGLVTPSARSAPLLMCGRALSELANIMSTWPPSRSVMAGAVPLYGTFRIFRLAIIFMRSPAMCSDEPMAPSAMVYLPGLACTCDTNSAMDRAGKSLRVTSTLGTLASMLMGVKSPIGSNGSLRYRDALMEKLVNVTSKVLPSGLLLAT